MKLIRAVLTVAAAGLMFTAGCASSAVLVGPRPVSAAPAGETVEGSGCGLLVFGLIPAGVNTRTERAYKNALGGRGTALSDTEIQYSWYWIPPVGQLVCTTLRGSIVR